MNDKQRKALALSKVIVLGMIMGGMVLSGGCGKTSLLGNNNSGDEPGVSGAQNSLNNGNYDGAISASTAVLNTASVASSEKGTASLILGQAILGKNKVTAIDLMNSIGDKSSNGPQNVISLLPSSISIGEAMYAAIALNYAASSLGTAALRSASQTGGISAKVLSNGDDVIRGVANLMVLARTIMSYITISESNNGNLSNISLTGQNSISTYKGALTVFFTPIQATNLPLALQASASTFNIATSMTKAYDAFVDAKLVSGQLTSITNVKTAINQLQALYNVVKVGGSGTFSYTNSSDASATITTSSDDSDVKEAIMFVLKTVK